MIHHITRATRHLIFWSLIAAAIGMSGIRLVLSGVESYKSRLADRIGEYLETPVTIGRLGATMRGFSPELVLSDIDVASDSVVQETAVALKEIRIGINLMDVLVNRELMASSWTTLVGAKLSLIRHRDGSLSIAGLKAGDARPLWLLEGRKYEVLNSEITWQDEQKNGPSLTFHAVDMALINDGSGHRINALMRLPDNYGETLRISLNVTGNLFNPAELHGHVFIDGRRIRLPAWMKSDLPFDIAVKSGTANVQLWGDWQGSRWSSVSGLMQLENLKLHRQQTESLAVAQLKSRFRLNLADDTWRLHVKEFQMETSDASTGKIKKWPNADFSVSASRSDAFLSRIGFHADELDLQEASLIARFFIPVSERRGQILRTIRLAGVVRNFSVFASPAGNAFAVNGRFEGLGIDPVGSMPGVKNVSGQIRGDEKQGLIELASDEAQLTSDLFRKPLPIDRLEGTLGWRQTEELWRFSSALIRLESSSFKSKNRLRLDIAKADGHPFLDWQSSFEFEDVSDNFHYLPVGMMSPGLADWFDHAFVRGRLSEGGLLFHGYLKDYPFKDGSGVFETRFHLDRLELAYHPSWPHLTGVVCDVDIYRDDLSVSLMQGTSHGLKIREAHVAMPSLSQGEQLLINGEAEGKIARALDFLQHTPLSSPVDHLLDAAEPEGDALVTLSAKIPLHSDSNLKVDGMARLNQASLRVISLDLPVTRIKGAIRFDEHGIGSDGIEAHALGHPIQITMESGDQETLIDVIGRAGIDALQAQFNMPWWHLADGETDYRIRLRLPYDQTIPVLQVESFLEGVALDLPGALAKNRSQRKALSLSFNLSDKLYLPIEFDYDKKLKAAVRVDIKKQAVVSGRVLLGRGDVYQRREPGMTFEINTDSLALQEWLGFALNRGNKAGVIDDVKEIRLHADHAFWYGSELGRLDLDLKNSSGRWDGNVGSRFASGRVQIPVDMNDREAVRLNLDKLDLSIFKKIRIDADAEGTPMMPNKFPLVSVTSQNTVWMTAPLGVFVLETRRGPDDGWLIQRMELAGADQKLSMTGNWKMTGNESFTRIKGRLDLVNAGNLFSKLKINSDLTETGGAIDFAFNWQAPPFQVALRQLKGDIEVNFKKGRILSIEPGFGRVLGILAMGQWLKRLQLDFSDVYQEGLTFNSIKGNFVLTDGKAVTRNLVVDAVPAKFALSGDTDLINRTVHHIVNVTPKSADALPIAGTIMDRVAAFVAKSLTGAEQEGFFFGSQYLVSGKWGNVQISSMHENDGLFPKTWDGITDFPWLQ
ncbi:MAG: YhdP family protein [Gammaproteobacteria bacterium]